ncbi:acetyl-CoA synthetase [Acrasis kona]|uniref:medium-chain acyl-CoA ligase n=1 Tax=Acrasis kona TaxID=1008807 RepID=A0AAW2YZT4_9EUKA
MIQVASRTHAGFFRKICATGHGRLLNSRLYSSYDESRSGTNHPSQAVDLGNLLCDRHARKNPNKIALNYFAKVHEDTLAPEIQEQTTWEELSINSNLFAHFLHQEKPISIRKHERVAILLPKSLELMISSIATWRIGGCIVPLFTGLGQDSIKHRILDSGAKVIITDASNRERLSSIPEIVDDPSMKIITVYDRSIKSYPPFVAQSVAREFNFWERIQHIASDVTLRDQVASEKVDQNDNLILMYTAGSTSIPNAVMVPVKALQSFEAYMTYSLHVQPDDVYWNVADPGWAYGMYYNVCGTLLSGITTIFLNEPFDPSVAVRLVQDHRVTNLAAPTTCYRAIASSGITCHVDFPIKLTSVGEPLSPAVGQFYQKSWNGLRVHEHYGQTEMGMLVCNHHHPALKKELRQGAMGSPMPGFQMAIVDAENHQIKKIGHSGQLAICVNESPLNFFRGYWNNDHKTVKRLVLSPDGDTILSLTGDAARMDQDGYFYYEGKSQDIIMTSAVRISPREVEDALVDHPAVKESGVVGAPDSLRGEIVVAFVVLKHNYVESEDLRDNIKLFIKDKLSKHQYPREIYFVESLPYGTNGKLQRSWLKNKIIQKE